MKNNDLLYDLLVYYENVLSKTTYLYTLKNNINIKINFYTENFCHLLGIQHIFPQNKHYIGKAGYDKIKNHKLQINNLKNHNGKEYKKIKLKLEHFQELHIMLENGEIVKFYQERVRSNTLIKADFIIYKNGQKYILHLFLRKDNPKSTEFYPTSFIVTTQNDKNPNLFIENQEYKKIINFKKITRNNDNNFDNKK